MAITLDFTGDAEAFINKIKGAVLANSGEFNGDETSGNIKINTPFGDVAANYKIDGSQITIDILKKPFFVSEDMIKNEIVKKLEPE